MAAKKKKKQRKKQEPIDRKVPSGLPDLPIVAVLDSKTHRPVPMDEFVKCCVDFLEEQKNIQQELVNQNYDILPKRSGDDIGSKWARDNVEVPEGVIVSNDYIEKFWTIVGDKIEAARLILAGKKRDEIADGFDELGWDISYKKLKAHISPKEWLDWRLVDNIRKSGKHPEIPQIKRSRFPYNQMNEQVCQQEAFLDVICCINMAVGSRRFDTMFYAGDLSERYNNIEKVSRPTMRLVPEGTEIVNGKPSSKSRVAFDFSVDERVPVRKVQKGHVVSFDRNMDHANVISGARMNKDGSISREMGPSLETLRVINNLNKHHTERDRCVEKLGNLMPYADSKRRERLETQIQILNEKIENEKKEIDRLEAHDIRCHVLPNELLGIEQLDMFGGGFVKFRHGSSDDAIEHATERDGGKLVHVNPSGSSSKCPRCYTKLKHNKEENTELCPNCGYDAKHDYGANAILGQRTFGKLDVKIPTEELGLPTLDVEAERSERKRRKRLEKMARRRERGSSTYPIKATSSPRRPRKHIREEVRADLRDVSREPSDVKISLEELRDMFEKGFEKLGEEVNSPSVAGSSYRDASLRSRDSSTNVFHSEFGYWTSYAFFGDLYRRSLMNAEASAAASETGEAGSVEPAAKCMQENVSDL